MFRSPYLKYIENWQNTQFHIFLDSLEPPDSPPPELIEYKVKGIQLMEKSNKQIRRHYETPKTYKDMPVIFLLFKT